jgi:hypothetical protein
VGWACATANVADNTFQWLIRQVDRRMIVLSDTGFHATEGDPGNLKLCQRVEWQERLLVETVLSMLTVVCHFKKVMHRVWAYFHARLAFTMAAFNLLGQIPRSLLRLLQRCYCRSYERLSAQEAQRLGLDLPYRVSREVSTGYL